MHAAADYGVEPDVSVSLSCASGVRLRYESVRHGDGSGASLTPTFMGGGVIPVEFSCDELGSGHADS